MVEALAIDASVTAAWCFSDEATVASDALREGLSRRGAVVPVLWHAESANVLLVAERQERITADRYSELLELLGALPIATDGGTTQSVMEPRLSKVHLRFAGLWLVAEPSAWQKLSLEFRSGFSTEDPRFIHRGRLATSGGA
jgi:predicted nucleic acid-binding protein